MAGRRKPRQWRQVFLRALRRTGNVRASAVEAGVDAGTAYDHRARDAGFRAKWAGALAAFRARPSPSRRGAAGPSLSPNGRGGQQELVLRRSRTGDRLVRPAAGRWSRRVEESFLDGLEATGSVTAAAAAAGLSTSAFQRRRDRYPEFAARWEARVARFREQLPELINAAAIESMSPAAPGAKRRGRARLPKLNAGEAIKVYAINEAAKAKARGPARRGGISSQELRPKRSEEEVKEDLVQAGMKLLGMMERRDAKERRAGGWTRIGGLWLPPGWSATPPEGWPGDPPAPEAPAGGPG